MHQTAQLILNESCVSFVMGQKVDFYNETLSLNGLAISLQANIISISNKEEE